MGSLLVDLGNSKRPGDCFELVLGRFQTTRMRWQVWAACSIKEGAHQEALVCLEKLEKRFSVVVVHAVAMRQRTLGRAGGWCCRASCSNARCHDPNPIVALLHALGRTDKQGQYRQAFDSYVQSNALRCLNFLILSPMRPRCSNHRGLWCRESRLHRIDRFSLDAPIFIVGMRVPER